MLIIGSLINNNGEGYGNVIISEFVLLQTLLCSLDFFKILFFQMMANFSGIEFYKTVLKFWKRKRKLFSCVMQKM